MGNDIYRYSNRYIVRLFFIGFSILLLAGLFLGACSVPYPSPLPRSTSTITTTQRPVTPTATETSTAANTYTPSPTSTRTETSTSTQLPTLTFTPEPLALFETKALRQDVKPSLYLKNNCAYLSRFWSKDSSSPGTVVVPVMFHSIVKNGRTVTDPKDISEEQFQAFVQYASYLGFRTITTAQLLGFLENNDPIPPRSMILILDDRRPGVVREHFLPVLESQDWTLTLAYIADPNTMQWAMEEVQLLAAESGRLDIQSHGYSGQLYIVDQTTRAEIEAEIWDSTPVLEAGFGQTPLAFIWPGGNFTEIATQIAREGGYRLGFTAYSRGPLLFNWIPQGEPEQAISDPLMLLPRAWSNSVNVNLNEAITISEQAVDFARKQYPFQAEYFRTYCGGKLPPLEQILAP